LLNFSADLNKLKNSQNCQQIYNNFYNIFNPEISNNIQISDLKKKNTLTENINTLSPEKPEYHLDAVDYKRLLNEKNEYIKLLLSENNKLKDKVRSFPDLD
jgi:murein L,D-transpeptidase YcbB/YkuD